LGQSAQTKVKLMKSKVLFVDDEQMILDVHRRQARSFREEWDTRFALSGEIALKLLSEEPADVVVSDLQMPGMKGLELVAKIKKRFPNTQCIILTGTADMQTAIDTINQGDVFRFYVKPSAFADLAAGISDAAAIASAALGESQTSNIGRVALDSMPFAVFVVSVDAEVLFTNAIAQALVERKECLSIGHDRVLRVSRPSETLSLHLAIANVAASVPPTKGQALHFERTSGERPYYCAVQPFPEKSVVAPMQASVYVTDPEKAPLVSPEILSGLFDLTTSESKLLVHLVASGKLEQAAEDAGLTVSTARTYLKQIFSKTDTGRQGELIQMVLLSPAIFAKHD